MIASKVVAKCVLKPDSALPCQDARRGVGNQLFLSSSSIFWNNWFQLIFLIQCSFLPPSFSNQLILSFSLSSSTVLRQACCIIVCQPDGLKPNRVIAICIIVAMLKVLIRKLIERWPFSSAGSSNFKPVDWWPSWYAAGALLSCNRWARRALDKG